MTATVKSRSGARLQNPRRRPSWVRELPRIVLLLLLALVFLAPLYWMLSTSFKTDFDAILMPPQWLPARPTLENYREILTSPDANFVRWTLNSLFSALAFTIVHLLVCAMAAYPLARMKFRGRDAWFWVILASMMVPGIVTLVPSFAMMLNFNWINTYHALIWPGVAGAFGVFLLRQFFSGLPGELEEAARIDGANSWVILWKIIVPLSVPALISLGTFAFMGSWNNYVWPLFVTSGEMQTLPVGVASYVTRYTTEYGKLMAGTALAAIPPLIAYLLAQGYLEQGVAVTGMKE